MAIVQIENGRFRFFGFFKKIFLSSVMPNIANKTSINKVSFSKLIPAGKVRRG